MIICKVMEVMEVKVLLPIILQLKVKVYMQYLVFIMSTAAVQLQLSGFGCAFALLLTCVL